MVWAGQRVELLCGRAGHFTNSSAARWAGPGDVAGGVSILARSSLASLTLYPVTTNQSGNTSTENIVQCQRWCRSVPVR